MDGRFRSIWLVDFEFTPRRGEPPVPLCVVAIELRTGRVVRRWLEGAAGAPPPFEIGEDDLLVAFAATAELSCFAALSWPEPENVLDLSAEFRVAKNGVLLPSQCGLLDALRFHGIAETVPQDMKDRMRRLAIDGGPYDRNQASALIDYCETDVRALQLLLPAMLPGIDMPRALVRGAYLRAISRVEAAGVPIDVPRFEVLKDRWEDLKNRLAYLASLRYSVDGRGVFHGTRFDQRAFRRFLERRGISWPRLPSGRLDLKDETFRDMARVRPDLGFLREVRRTLANLRLSDLPVGADGRARTELWPFSSRTGRNQPRSSAFIFNMPVWMRSLVRPASGTAVAMVDWEQQEFAIAAALSGDGAMQAAYLSGDPYLSFAKMAGAAPADATKKTHHDVRETYKTVVLATQYMQMAPGLGARLGIPAAYAEELLRQHRRAFPRYWSWSDSVAATAAFEGEMVAAFGWRTHVGVYLVKDRSIRNWPIQSTGSEMLRVACIRAMEEGVRVCAPVHDALLVEAPAAEIDDAIATTQAVMREASEIVLDGFPLRTEAKVFRHPDRYVDPRGVEIWDLVHNILGIDP